MVAWHPLRKRQPAWPLWLLGLVVVSLGCGEKPQIRQYRITGEMPEELVIRDRMLAAIVPQEKDIWFFKLMGPQAAVDTVAPQIEKFVKELTFKDGSPELSQVPRGWNDGGSKPMRFKTYLIDTPEAQLDLSISSLPRAGEWDQQVTMNVNRWRGQLQMAPSTEHWAGAGSIEVAALSQPAVWVDLVGEQSSAGMTAPGMGPGMGPMTSPDMSSAIGAANPVQPENSKPSEPSTGEAESPLEYKLPEGWVVGEKRTMRLASFQIGTAEAPAELTVIPAGGDLRGNVARWLGQIRTTPPSDEEVDKALEAAEKLTLFGRDATRYQLTSDQAGDNATAIDATIVPLEDGFSLFIKATGPTSVLTAQRERIGQFLESLKLK